MNKQSQIAAQIEAQLNQYAISGVPHPEVLGERIQRWIGEIEALEPATKAAVPGASATEGEGKSAKALLQEAVKRTQEQTLPVTILATMREAVKALREEGAPDPLPLTTEREASVKAMAFKAFDAPVLEHAAKDENPYQEWLMRPLLNRWSGAWQFTPTSFRIVESIEYPGNDPKGEIIAKKVMAAIIKDVRRLAPGAKITKANLNKSYRWSVHVHFTIPDRLVRGSKAAEKASLKHVIQRLRSNRYYAAPVKRNRRPRPSYGQRSGKDGLIVAPKGKARKISPPQLAIELMEGMRENAAAGRLNIERYRAAREQLNRLILQFRNPDLRRAMRAALNTIAVGAKQAQQLDGTFDANVLVPALRLAIANFKGVAATARSKQADPEGATGFLRVNLKAAKGGRENYIAALCDGIAAEAKKDEKLPGSADLPTIRRACSNVERGLTEVAVALYKKTSPICAELKTAALEGDVKRCGQLAKRIAVMIRATTQSKA